MTNSRGEAAATATLPQALQQYFAENLPALQQARLDRADKAALEDLLRGRNAFQLRAAGQRAFQLTRQCLDSYFAASDAQLFADFARELAAFAERRNLPKLQDWELVQGFAHDRLPLRIELAEARDRASNRLTHEFFIAFCDEGGGVNWERLSRFMSDLAGQDRPGGEIEKAS